MNQRELTGTISARDPEQWLLQRLQQQGVDVYAPKGPFDCLRDRLAQAILDNKHGPVVAGRHNGRPETFAELFERMYSVSLSDHKRRMAQS